MIDKGITYLLPTANRYHFLYRLLSYYRSTRMTAPALILDSSDRPIREDIKRDFGDLKTVSYYSYDPKLSYQEKFLDGLTKVETPYVMFWADDDLIVPSTVERAVHYLECHTDFSVVHGDCWAFTVGKIRNKMDISGAVPYFQPSLRQASAQDRLVRHFTQYGATFYSVHRTVQLLENWTTILPYRFHTSFDELALSGLSVIQGKVFKLNALCMLKQRHNFFKIGYASGIKKDYMDVLMSAEYREDYFKLLECLSKPMAVADGVPIEFAHACVKQAFWAYLSRTLKIKYINKFYKNNKLFQYSSKLIMYPINALRRSGKEFNLIRQAVQKFHREIDALKT